MVTDRKICVWRPGPVLLSPSPQSDSNGAKQWIEIKTSFISSVELFRTRQLHRGYISISAPCSNAAVRRGTLLICNLKGIWQRQGKLCITEKASLSYHVVSNLSPNWLQANWATSKAVYTIFCSSNFEAFDLETFLKKVLYALYRNSFALDGIFPLPVLPIVNPLHLWSNLILKSSPDNSSLNALVVVLWRSSMLLSNSSTPLNKAILISHSPHSQQHQCWHEEWP